MLCKISGSDESLFFSCEMKFLMELVREVVAYQSSAHSFTQSFDQSLVPALKYYIGTKPHILN